MAKTPMTKTATARIQSATAKSSGGTVSKSSFAARVMSTATKNSKK